LISYDDYPGKGPEIYRIVRVVGEMLGSFTNPLNAIADTSEPGQRVRQFPPTEDL
jgi:hypothetical protein